MVQICVLIKAEKVSVFEVIKQLEKMPGMIDAFATFGRFDVVAFFSVEKLEDVRPLIKNVGGLVGVLKTETLVEI